MIVYLSIYLIKFIWLFYSLWYLDSGLTSEGIEFAKSLGEFFESDKSGFSNITSSQGLVVWTSSLKSAIQTAEYIKPKIRTVEWRALREIESGVCDGLTYDQIKVRYPKEYQARQQDKLTYRYPRGESYFDVITRLEPLIFEVNYYYFYYSCYYYS